MRLADGTLWPIPITLDVNAETAAKYPVGSKVALIDNEVLACARSSARAHFSTCVPHHTPHNATSHNTLDTQHT